MIEGVEIDVGRDAVWLRSAAPLRVLASAVVGGDLDVTRHVVNMHVRRGYDSADPGRDLSAFARGLGIAEPFVGLMTAAWTHEARIVWEEADGVRVGAVATVGLGMPVAAGVTPPVAWQPSTINVVVVARRGARARRRRQRRHHGDRGEGRGAGRGGHRDGGGSAARPGRSPTRSSSRGPAAVRACRTSGRGPSPAGAWRAPCAGRSVSGYRPDDAPAARRHPAGRRPRSRPGRAARRAGIPWPGWAARSAGRSDARPAGASPTARRP